MAKSMMGLWSQSLLTSSLIVAANRAEAQRSLPSTSAGQLRDRPPELLSGPSLTIDPSAAASTFAHTWLPGPCTRLHCCTRHLRNANGDSSACDPFTITTSGNTFTLGATSTIASDLGYDRLARPRGHVTTSLPDCSVFPASHERHVHAERRIHAYTGISRQSVATGPVAASYSTASPLHPTPTRTCLHRPASLLCLHVPPPRPARCTRARRARRAS